MKNSEIHNGLDQKEIRDFLSMAIVKNFESDKGGKKERFPYDEKNPLEWSIKNKEAEIIVAKNQLQSLKERQSILLLIQSKNWQEWDVSDGTERDLKDYTLIMNFVGTEEEYNTLLKKIKEEEK